MEKQNKAALPRILVLMSAYNGEKYLPEQIQSILGQQGVEAYLLIRDDGSKDGTAALVEDLHSDRIQLDRRENLGYMGSFMTLLQQADLGYDYYAFADQDDVWLEDKLITAIRMLRKQEGPALYCSGQTYTDEKLQPIDTCHSNLDDLPEGVADPRWAVCTGIYGLGCTYVWNAEMQRAVAKGLKTLPAPPFPHDNFLSVAAPFLGTLIRTGDQKMLYRQHGSNAGGNKKQEGNRLKRALSTMTSLDDEDYRIRAWILEHYQDQIPSEKRTILEQSLNYKKDAALRYRMLTNNWANGLNHHEQMKFAYRVLVKKL